ncbi:hypothetical protein BGS_0198 [Beggiatoa sp. SS]|nr:hypothetical protein BGS_0198 [Beggiatoa sp. SS]
MLNSDGQTEYQPGLQTPGRKLLGHQGRLTRQGKKFTPKV